MANHSKLSETEKAEAIELLKNAGCNSHLNPSVGYEEYMYAAVLRSDRTTAEIQKIYDQYQKQSQEKWDDNRDDREVSIQVQKALGLWED
ncbi:hypothetical protein [Anabaena azotica]|uniref:Uncharacterized protein n=1 Tax=Anabaena azotica FACHB-119 TaxID=947527 RepID=A0ABR8CWN4_9NOST|nr:hypothetical protein [Anabaena azotica]MBD2499137.1 hypothetical protein [Anabaena azotica FACHB-119]